MNMKAKPAKYGEGSPKLPKKQTGGPTKKSGGMKEPRKGKKTY